MGGVIKKEICFILQDEINDPRIGFVTITRVKMSDDLRMARIYYSTLGGEYEKERVKEGLDRARGYMRKTLGKRLKTRYVPDLIFEFDDSLEYGDHIESLIRDLNIKDSE